MSLPAIPTHTHIRLFADVCYSNQADLALLQEMGISPDMSVHEKRPSLRTVGLTVLATVRMQRMQREWAGSKRVQESLVRKLESMKRGKSVGR